MRAAQEVYAEINSITERLIRLGISDRQHFPSMRSVENRTTIVDVSGVVLSGIGFGGRPYREVYEEIEGARAYNVRLLDGGLLLLQYAFHDDVLVRHRLAFWASPTLEAFQNEPELYELDELYLDFLDRSIVPFPIRFDFSLDTAANSPIVHPRSHMTLGQYKNCRIPVSSPLSPSVFIDFVLRNFYSSAYRRFSTVASGEPRAFEVSLYDEEHLIPHMALARRSHPVASTLRAVFGRGRKR